MRSASESFFSHQDFSGAFNLSQAIAFSSKFIKPYHTPRCAEQIAFRLLHKSSSSLVRVSRFLSENLFRNVFRFGELLNLMHSQSHWPTWNSSFFAFTPFHYRHHATPDPSKTKTCQSFDMKGGDLLSKLFAPSSPSLSAQCFEMY